VIFDGADDGVFTIFVILMVAERRFYNAMPPQEEQLHKLLRGCRIKIGRVLGSSVGMSVGVSVG